MKSKEEYFKLTQEFNTRISLNIYRLNSLYKHYIYLLPAETGGLGSKYEYTICDQILFYNHLLPVPEEFCPVCKRYKLMRDLAE